MTAVWRYFNILDKNGIETYCKMLKGCALALDMLMSLPSLAAQCWIDVITKLLFLETNLTNIVC